MRRGKAVFQLAALACAAGTCAAAACAQIVGVDGYKNAIEELCGTCESEFPGCADGLEQSLASAPDDEVRAWLETYDDLRCDKARCDLELERCYYAAPGLCTEQGEGCVASETCCGFDFDAPHDGAGCCDNGGNGACCAKCHTCAERVEAYAREEAFDDATLCRSQAASWKDLLACAADDPMKPDLKCNEACIGALATYELCKGCLAKKCSTQFEACGADTGF